MIFHKTDIDGLYTVTLQPVADERGFFVRSFCIKEISGIKKSIRIVQINHTLTREQGSIRGMHYQIPPYAETKIVRCIRGSVFDVAVDLRKDSKTYLQWYGEILSADNMKMMLIPEGFAHGFQTLEDNCEMLYLHSEFYNKEHEGGIRSNDAKVGIKWKIPASNISERDSTHPLITSSFKGIEL